MESNKVAQMQYQIDQLNTELQHQKGMLWMIGEIIKNATSIDTFRELMKLITDMLMGVMGVSSCYIWVHNTSHQYTLHFRSIFLKNKYTEVVVDSIPIFLKEVEEFKPFQDLDIRTPLIESTPLPSSRLAVPLYDFELNVPVGFLVVEHASTNFFTETTTLLFKTLAIIIGSNSQKSKLFEIATKEAEHDPLTKIYNRKFLSKFLDKFEATGAPLSLCILDIDSFKNINDTYGHTTGDDVLIAIAQTTHHIVKPYNGKAIRYGGDEFVILLDLPLQESIPILEQIRTKISELPITEQISNGITVTMGVSQYPYHTDNINHLLSLSDTALLQGKALGKDILKIVEKGKS
ncbi:MAG TPA: GGDEF domain-containing protein [Clostridiales bacterium]|nr:GGDEF domain-containing protein [Clostridiales bacterium]